MAGFSAACLLTLVLLTPPFNHAQKISLCLFSTALPVLVWARAAMHSESKVVISNISAKLAITGYALALLGFAMLLGSVYSPACILFVLATVVTLVVWENTLH